MRTRSRSSTSSWRTKAGSATPTSPSRPSPYWRVDTMRPFGHAEDLDLDFGQSDRPALVTTLLASCSGDGDAAFWWSQPVGLRTATLLRLVVLTDHRVDVSLNRRCGAAGC